MRLLERVDFFSWLFLLLYYLSSQNLCFLSRYLFLLLLLLHNYRIQVGRNEGIGFLICAAGAAIWYFFSPRKSEPKERCVCPSIPSFLCLLLSLFILLFISTSFRFLYWVFMLGTRLWNCFCSIVLEFIFFDHIQRRGRTETESISFRLNMNTTKGKIVRKITRTVNRFACSLTICANTLLKRVIDGILCKVLVLHFMKGLPSLRKVP